MLWVEEMVPEESRRWIAGYGEVSEHARGRSGPEGLVISCLIQGVETPCSLRLVFSRQGSKPPLPSDVEGGGGLVGGGEAMRLSEALGMGFYCGIDGVAVEG